MNSTPNKLFNITGGTTMDGNLAMGNDIVNQEPDPIDELIIKYESRLLNAKQQLADTDTDNPIARSFLFTKIEMLEEFIKDLKTL